MAWAFSTPKAPTLPPLYYALNSNNEHSISSSVRNDSSALRFLVRSHSRKKTGTRCKLRNPAPAPAPASVTIDSRVVEKDDLHSQLRSGGSIEIPVTCYQLIGVPDKAEKDEIVKSVMQLKSAEIEEGYTMETVASRQELLMDVRDKLLFEPEYAGNLREKIPPKSSLRITWAWLPAALCLLQEVGEEMRVLDIGRAALQRPDAKPYIHDILLSMALAECAIAKIGFERYKVSQGFEALARAQCLLRSRDSLGKLVLLSQIEESLEELAPACTLELLGMPYSSENAERRRGAISALRELIRQGLDVESSCRVQDWPWFMSQALKKLTASEIVDLLPWDDLAVTRKNKKSLESQNQRVIIDSKCFYIVTIAHIAFGFSSRQTGLINKAKIMCECLTAADGVDLKLEEAFCLFLLGQGSEAEAIERLQQLESNSNSATWKSVAAKEIKDIFSATPSLELWLKDAVLAVFTDTGDSSPSLVSFFGGGKKILETQKTKGTQTMPSIGHRQIATTMASERRDFEDSIPHINSSQPLRSVVKQLTPTDLQSPFISGKISSESDASTHSVQLKRNIGIHNGDFWRGLLTHRNIVGRISSVAALGCIVFAIFRLSGMKSNNMSSASEWNFSKRNKFISSSSWTSDSSLEYSVRPAEIIARGLNKLLSKVKLQFGNQPGAGNSRSSHLTASLSSSLSAVRKSQMPVEEAEALVNQWQVIKAEALGPSHEAHALSDILDEPMLTQWQALADAAKAKSCYWRFVLLQMSILRAEVLSDLAGMEVAEIEAILEEAAELVESSRPKNPNYYSTYKIRYVLKRQDDGSWRFCDGDIETESSS